MTIALRKLSGLVLLLALVACGGGGGGGSEPLTNSDPGTNTGGINPGSNTGTEPVPGGPVASDQGVEFRVNTSTALSQDWPAIARFPDGGYVIVWATGARARQVDAGDDPRNGIYAQRYGADGAPIGGETRIDTYMAGEIRRQPMVTALADGGYLVGWIIEGEGFTRPMRQRMLPDGSRGHFTEDFQEPFQPLTPSPWLFAVAGLANGGYAVLRVYSRQSFVRTWVQRYGADDVALDQPQEVSPGMPGMNGLSMVGMPDGGFLVAWGGGTTGGPWNLLGSETDIYTRRYDANGSASAPVQVTQVGRGQGLPDVAVLKGGGYALTWTSYQFDTPSGRSTQYVMTQAFRTDGSPVGSATRTDPSLDLPPSTCTSPCAAIAQAAPSVGALEDGGYVVAWRTPDRPGGIYARRYDAQGSALGPVSRATSSNAFSRDSSMVAGLGNGGFVIGWKSEGEDGDLGGIYARQWGPTGLR